MLSSVGQNNTVQAFSAVNALRSSSNLLKPKEAGQENIIGRRVAGKCGASAAPPGVATPYRRKKTSRLSGASPG